MPRKESKAVSEGNGPTFQDAWKMITWKELRRVLPESMSKAFGEFKGDLRSIDQRLASLEQDARQPRFAMEADVPADKKTRERTEGGATAVQVRVDFDPKISTSFGVDFTRPPTFPSSRGDALVGNGVAVPKSCLSPLEMRTPTAAGSLLLAGTASTATRITFDQPPLWFCPTEEINFRTSIQYSSYYSIFWRINNQQAPFWPRVIETKSGQNLVFDPGGSTGRLRACPFLEMWCALFCGKVFVRALDEAAVFFGGWITWSHLEGEEQANRLRRTYSGRSLFLCSQAV